MSNFTSNNIMSNKNIIKISLLVGIIITFVCFLLGYGNSDYFLMDHLAKVTATINSGYLETENTFNSSGLCLWLCYLTTICIITGISSLSLPYIYILLPLMVILSYLLLNIYCYGKRHISLPLLIICLVLYIPQTYGTFFSITVHGFGLILSMLILIVYYLITANKFQTFQNIILIGLLTIALSLYSYNYSLIMLFFLIFLALILKIHQIKLNKSSKNPHLIVDSYKEIRLVNNIGLGLMLCIICESAFMSVVYNFYTTYGSLNNAIISFFERLFLRQDINTELIYSNTTLLGITINIIIVAIILLYLVWFIYSILNNRPMHITDYLLGSFVLGSILFCAIRFFLGNITTSYLYLASILCFAHLLFYSSSNITDKKLLSIQKCAKSIFTFTLILLLILSVIYVPLYCNYDQKENNLITISYSNKATIWIEERIKPSEKIITDLYSSHQMGIHLLEQYPTKYRYNTYRDKILIITKQEVYGLLMMDEMSIDTKYSLLSYYTKILTGNGWETLISFSNHDIQLRYNKDLDTIYSSDVLRINYIL